MNTTIHCAIMIDQREHYHFLFSFSAESLGQLLRRASNRTFPLDSSIYQNKQFHYDRFTVNVWHFQPMSRAKLYAAYVDALRHCSEAHPALFAKSLSGALEAVVS